MLSRFRLLSSARSSMASLAPRRVGIPMMTRSFSGATTTGYGHSHSHEHDAHDHSHYDPVDPPLLEQGIAFEVPSAQDPTVK